MACHSPSAPLSNCEVKRNLGGEGEKKAEARSKQRERWGRNRRVGKEGGNSQQQGDPGRCCWQRVPSLAPRTLPGQCLPSPPPNPACSTVLRSPDRMLFHAVKFRPLPALQELSALRPVLETLAHFMRWSPLSLTLW